MEVIYLTQDGRCKWLENQVMKKLFPEIISSSRNHSEPKKYVIIDWISNDNGKIGVDLKWFKKLGIPAVNSFKDLPAGNNYSVINTGYDSIVHEEKLLLERNIHIIDKPCPYIRKIRKLFEHVDDKYQYVLLCEPNHIIIKNFASLYPKDLILVQMGNYKELIIENANGKPFMFISYVTFLKRHSGEIFDFINETYPNRGHMKVDTQCMWADSKKSPLNEINNLSEDEIASIDCACLIGTKGSTNKSLISMVETIEGRGLKVQNISSLKEFIQFKRTNDNSRILLVKSPIPNDAEKPILVYLKHGYFRAYATLLLEQSQIKKEIVNLTNKFIYYKYILTPQRQYPK